MPPQSNQTNFSIPTPLEVERQTKFNLYHAKVIEKLGIGAGIYLGGNAPPNLYIADPLLYWNGEPKLDPTPLEIVYRDFMNTLTGEVLDTIHIGRLDWTALNNSLQTEGLFLKFYQASKKVLKIFVPFSLVILSITQLKNQVLLSRYYADLMNEYQIAYAADNTLPLLGQADLDYIEQALYNNFFDVTLFGFVDPTPLPLPEIPTEPTP